MGLFDKGEFTLYLEHLFALVKPHHRPTTTDTYGVDVGDIADWSPADMSLLIEEGRRQLDALDESLERIRSRGQALFTVMLGFFAVAVGTTFLSSVAGSIGAFVVWYLGLAIGIVGLLGAAAVFATTAEMGSVDTVLLSREDPTSGVSRSVALAYPKAVKRSMLTVMSRFTVLRDATWFSIIGALLVGAAWVWLRIAS
jgi:hypothetical protein